jgi:ribose/xylose/arabinose/galactoside ABC-type transport system permease subunit
LKSAVGINESGVSAKERWGKVITKRGTLAGMILILLVLGILSPQFFAISNLLEILKQGSILTMVALSQTIVLVAGGFDLSAGAVVHFVSNLSAGMISGGQHVTVVLFMGILIGCVAGVLNAVLVNQFKIPPFVATLGVMFVLAGITLAYNQGKAIPLKGYPEFTYLGQGYVGPIPFIVIVVMAMMLAMHLHLKRTAAGLRMYAAGQNPQAARIRGISTSKSLFAAFVIGGLILGLTGVFHASYNYGSSAVASGLDFLISALAAAFLGSTFSKTGELSVIGTTCAGMFIAALSNGLIINGVSNTAMSGILGSILVISVILSVLHKREIGQVTIF